MPETSDGGRNMLDELKTQRKVVGIKQLRKSLKDGQVRMAYVAENADPRLTDPLKEECQRLGVELIVVPTMTELGHACGISVGAAAAGLLT